MSSGQDMAAGRDEEGRLRTAVQTLLILALFFAILVIGFNWRFSPAPSCGHGSIISACSH